MILFQTNKMTETFPPPSHKCQLSPVTRANHSHDGSIDRGHNGDPLDPVRNLGPRLARLTNIRSADMIGNPVHGLNDRRSPQQRKLNMSVAHTAVLSAMQRVWTMTYHDRLGVACGVGLVSTVQRTPSYRLADTYQK